MVCPNHEGGGKCALYSASEFQADSKYVVEYCISDSNYQNCSKLVQISSHKPLRETVLEMKAITETEHPSQHLPSRPLQPGIDF